MRRAPLFLLGMRTVGVRTGMAGQTPPVREERAHHSGTDGPQRFCRRTGMAHGVASAGAASVG